MKTCSMCGLEKDESEFYKRSGTEKLVSQCKSCDNKRATEYRLKHLKERLAYEKRFREENRDLINSRRKNIYRKVEKNIKQEKQYYKNNYQKLRAAQLRWIEKNKEKFDAYQKKVHGRYGKKWRKELKDWYMVDLIFKYDETGLSRSEIRKRPDLIETKRATVLIDRLKMLLYKTKKKVKANAGYKITP